MIDCEYKSGKSESMSDKHYHSCLEVCFIESGGGNCIIDDSLCDFTEGDVMIIHPAQIHRSTYSSKTRSRFVLYVNDEDFIGDFENALGNVNIFRNSYLSKSFHRLFEKIMSECENRDEMSQRLAGGYLYEVLSLIVRNENQYKKGFVFSLFVEKTVDIINREFSNSELSISLIAKRLSVSREYLSRIFKKETGIDLSKYITNMRISHAEQMLLSKKDKSITAIAYSCGFCDSNYFSSVFKRMNGITPREFKNSSGFWP